MRRPGEADEELPIRRVKTASLLRWSGHVWRCLAKLGGLVLLVWNLGSGQGILPPQGVDAEPFWDAIKRALPHLNRSPKIGLFTCLPVPNPTNH